jgi:hypothetical protein
LEERHDATKTSLELAGLPFFVFSAARAQEPPKTSKALKIMMKSAWGSDDPTRASFVFVHGLALADAGHDVQIFLAGEATYSDAKGDSECRDACGLASVE